MREIFNGKPYVFISYSHKDSTEVHNLVNQLSAAGVRVWYDGDLPYINDYNDIIANAIENCTHFIVFFTKNSTSSQYVRSEVYHALNKGKNVSAVELEPCELLGGLDMRISHINRLKKSEISNLLPVLCNICIDCTGDVPLKPFSLPENKQHPFPKKEQRNPVIEKYTPPVPTPTLKDKHILIGVFVIIAVSVILSIALNACFGSKKPTIFPPDESCTGTSKSTKTSTTSTTTTTTTTTTKLSGIGFVKEGQIIEFGSYEQDGNTENGKEAIEWIVLEVETDRALLISKYGLDAQPYNNSLQNTTWAECSLRSWLNSTFYNKAFSSSEKEIIQKTYLTTPDNPDPYSAAYGGASTYDYVFLLSLDEVEKYFNTDASRVAQFTQYAKGVGSQHYNSGQAIRFGWWWLRTPGYVGDQACDIAYNGEINIFGTKVNKKYGCVRPAIYVYL